MESAVRRELRLLKLYAAVSTLAIVSMGASTCSRSPSSPAFDELTVQRLNVVEPDGRIRLVLSNSVRQAQATIEGKPIGPPRQRGAGLLFFNDEGSELGGLTFSGRRGDGGPNAYGGLTFDRYNQDEAVRVFYAEQGGQQLAGLSVIDRPETSLATVSDLMVEREAASGEARTAIETQMMARMGVAADRVFVGRLGDGSATLVLRDDQGRVTRELAP
jgi:hypothetical protein